MEQEFPLIADYEMRGHPQGSVLGAACETLESQVDR